ncbi:TetR/AcrR family transcriptional regulator [Paractinoplanes ferrugineus]|uniref:TetR family transcriptional regulator n=1 Tax=Paractinoplanes ferrugineus TaxID=113564 RepID=A0A919MH15_9ACTN|nr:TetR/AcrR family transcriptional regulator [Actinoplanes ferrugineus]GIE12180.1 TetR family transcriptional regulator [Actinoplanes ferrugineus]
MTMDFLWHERPKPARGPKAALTPAQITDVAIAIADAEGLGGLSMQRVAAELGYTKMSLYRYFPDKSEMVAAMLERAIGTPPELSEAPDTGWRTALTGWATELLSRYLAHAWALEASVGDRPIGPHELGWMEVALKVLPGALSGGERMDAVATVAGHVRAIASQKGGEAQLIQAMGLVLREHADRFPAVAAAMADPGVPDQAFGFGLERILDGLEVLLRRRV